MSQEFTKLDTDHNGQLTLAEFRAAAPLSARLDGTASATAMQRLDATRTARSAPTNIARRSLPPSTGSTPITTVRSSADERARAQAARAAKN